MKSISSAMQALLNQKSIPALATFWSVARKDGVVFGFTDWSETITAGGTTYRAKSGMTRSAIQQRADLSVPGFEATAIISSSDITDDDIDNGKYDGATVTVFMAVPTDVNFATYGTIPLPGYLIGQMTVKDGLYTAEVRGIGYKLQQTYIELFNPLCTADFGDARCKKDLGPLTDTGTVTAIVTPNKVVSVNLNSVNGSGAYVFGLVTFTSGAANGTSIEVSGWTGGTSASGNLAFYLPPATTIQVGDTFSIVPGCDKSYVPGAAGQGCYQWANTDNFRGFPFIPGMQFLTDYGVQIG